jgi:entericidin B
MENNGLLGPLSVMAIVALSLSLSACNTVKGVGQDLQRAGEKIEDVAKKK